MPNSQDDYEDKLLGVREECKEILEKHGLHVEDASDQIGLYISLTKFGLSGVYASLTQDEIEYIVDNEVEI